MRFVSPRLIPCSPVLGRRRESPDPHRRRKRRRSRRARVRRWSLGLIVTALTLTLVGVLSLLPALRIQRELVGAKQAIEAGRDAFFAGDLPRARRLFDQASSAFIRAGSRVDSPFLSLASKLPIIGRTPDAIEAMASAGANVASAGATLAHAVSFVPGGLGGLAPEDGTISLRALIQLDAVLDVVAAQVDEASAVLARTERTWVVPQVADARRQFEAPLATLQTALRAASAVTKQLPDFLGAHGVRRYFVAAQNPAELRGTGGFIGSYAILTTFKGALRFSTFEPIESLPDAVGRIKAPNPDYAARYRGFGGPGFWRNINVTPDFPSAAVSIERLYRVVTRNRLDGVIAANPQALAALLTSTGPVRVPSLGATLNAANVVDYTTNKAYSIISGVEQRKRVLGDAAKATFDRFVAGARNRINAVRALAQTVADGHLMFHAVDADEQAAFEAARAAGALLAPPGDYLAVSATNSAANKVDYYVERSVSYDVRLGDAGTAEASVRVTLDNPSPTRGQPTYVIGPFAGASEVGESVSFLSTYCGADCELQGHTRDGLAEPVGVERELGHRVFSELVRVPPGERTTLEYELALPDAWQGDSLAGAYVVNVQDQPGLIRPTTLTVTVHAPPGMEIAYTSEPMDVSGDRATWTGPASKLRTLRFEFEKPLLERTWKKLVRFVLRPLS